MNNPYGSNEYWGEGYYPQGYDQYGDTSYYQAPGYNNIAAQFNSPGSPYSPYAYPQYQKKKSSTLKIVLIISLILGVLLIIFGLIIGCLVLLIHSVSNYDISDGRIRQYSYDENPILPNSPDAAADINGPQISAVETSGVYSENTKVASDVYSKASPSIVCITSYKKGGDYTLDAEGEGSGIIFSADGYIVTNSHVVDDSKQTGVAVMLADGTQYLGTVIGIDVKTDLAVVKIDGKELTPAEFANSSSLVVGQEVFAIGNPGGSAFSNSLTKGTISALDRVIEGDSYLRYIQTDAAINPGNSGGALVNESGQVIGINTAKIVASGYEGMGFAIPSNTVIEIANKLVRYGYVNDRGTLGVDGTTVSLYSAKTNNVPQGMMITSISSESPLKKTDAQVDDIITHIEGKRVFTASDVTEVLKEYSPGDVIELTIFHPESGGGKEFTVKVKLLSDTGSK